MPWLRPLGAVVLTEAIPTVVLVAVAARHTVVEPIDSHPPFPMAHVSVTNTERFRPVHAHALAVLARLQSAYAVTASARFDPLPGVLSLFEHARPPVTLTPAVPAAAPLSVAFTTLPGLVVRAGHWYTTAFPLCGCDACSEGVVSETSRFDELVAHIVAGHFDEAVYLPLIGEARLAHAFGPRTGADRPRVAGWGVIARDRARALVGHGARRVEWQPWPHDEFSATDAVAAV